MKTETERLWQAVIDQALTDALYDGHRVNLDQQRAREWLTGDSRDFRHVCALAGLEPDEVRRRYADARKAKAREHDLKAELERFSQESGIPVNVIRERIIDGWSLADATRKHHATPEEPELPRSLVRPHRKIKFVINPDKHDPRIKLTHDDMTLTIREWALRTGIPFRTIKTRLAMGWTVERTLTTDPMRRGRSRTSAASKGTGGGSNAQHSAEIEFSQ